MDKKEIDDDDGYFVLCWCGGTQSSSLNMHTKYMYISKSTQPQKVYTQYSVIVYSSYVWIDGVLIRLM